MSNKRSRSVKQNDEEHLENILFGKVIQKGNTLTEFLPEEPPESDSEEEEKTKKKKQKISDLQPAWQDEDDSKIIINMSKGGNTNLLHPFDTRLTLSGTEFTSRLRQERLKIVKHDTQWADTVPIQDDIDDLLKSTKPLVEKRDAGLIEPGKIYLQQMKDLNEEEHSKFSIISQQFHPSGEFSMVASSDKTIRLFEVDGRKNTHLQSVYFRDLPITAASFSGDGNEIFVFGRKKFFYDFDIMSGKVGRVETLCGSSHNIQQIQTTSLSPSFNYLAISSDKRHISVLSQKTKQWICDLYPNTSISSMVFSHDSLYLYSAGEGGEVFVWDLRKQQCLRKYRDFGNNDTVLVVNCPRGIYQATGSKMGIVNVYRMDTEFSESQSPKPIKELMNLTTTITGLSFNHDSQLLAMCSVEKNDAFRLVHLPTCTVYTNWPSVKKQRAKFVTFSPDSSKFALSTPYGRVPLYRVRHYHPK